MSTFQLLFSFPFVVNRNTIIHAQKRITFRMKLKNWERKRSGFVRKYYPNDIKVGTKKNYENIEDAQPVFGEISSEKDEWQLLYNDSTE